MAGYHPYGACGCGGQANVVWRDDGETVQLWWQCRLCDKRWRPMAHDLGAFVMAHQVAMERVLDGEVYRSRWWYTTHDFDGPHGEPITDDLLNRKRKHLGLPPITGGRFCRERA